MPKQKRRFFKRSTKQTLVDEKNAVEKLQKGEVIFKSIQRVAKKQKEEKKKRPHFPNNSQSIPESASTNRGVRHDWRAMLPGSLTSLKNTLLVILLCVIGLVWNIWVGAGLYKNLLSWVRLMQDRQKLVDQMTLWENIAKEYPNYRDAYVEGEIYAYRLGDKSKEQYFLQNLQLLDPNFPITKSFGQLMQLQNSQ